MNRGGGFLGGVGAGVVLALAALWLTDPSALAGTGRRDALGAWLTLNLGHSSWLFAAVLGFFLVHLARLRRLLTGTPDKRAVVEMDQLTDVWIQVFVGIGVVWTAVGMRSALQVALADPEDALSDTAGSVLKRLVDGGILLALSTTIVGAVGGYLMRLGKTLYAGAGLHDFYESLQRADVRELVETVRRLESRLAAPVGTVSSARPDPAPIHPDTAHAPG